MDGKKIVGIGKEVIDYAHNSGITKLILGEYADGTTRSIPDAINGELYSPKQRAKAIKKGKNKKKRKKYKIDSIL